MSIRIDKPWLPLASERVEQLGGQLGVYELAQSGRIVLVGCADGRSLFGLRGELMKHLDSSSADSFRVEITSAYHTRYRELLMVHLYDFGHLPQDNDQNEAQYLGRLSPG